MQFLTNHLHLPRCRRRRQDTSGEDVEDGRSNVAAPPDNVVRDNSETVQGRVPDTAKTYRVLPIFSGLMIPFSIMLSIPTLTGYWYIRTEDNVTVEVRPNPRFLNVVVGLSTAFAILANAFLVVRFAERRVKAMTLASIAFLTLHDVMNIIAITVFGVIHRFDDNFTYGPSFWFAVCSTVASASTNITLIVDYLITKDFAHAGSGLTQKQRSLVIVVIVLLSYISIGSIIVSRLFNITFINALYFSVVTIETIGFGDIYPITRQAKIFNCFYIAGGVMNVAVAVTVARDAVVESAVEALRQRRLLRQRERHLKSRWRAAVSWRLQERNLPTWVNHHTQLEGKDYEGRWCGRILRWGHRLFKSISREENDPAWRYQTGSLHRRLNLEGLTDADLHAAALEVGAPLCKLVPESVRTRRSSSSGVPLSHPPAIDHRQMIHPSMSLTHARLGGMLALVGNFAIAVGGGDAARDDAEETGGSSPPEIVEVKEAANGGGGGDDNQQAISNHHPVRSTSHGEPLTLSATMYDDDRNSMEAALAKDVKSLFYTRLGLALLIFFTFWALGSVLFMVTEKWTFGSAVYFCYISFTTVGYGELTPKTSAGRSVFVFWALLGVAAMTILVSVLSEACTEQYKSSINSHVFQADEHERPDASPAPSARPREDPETKRVSSPEKLATKSTNIEELRHDDDVDEKGVVVEAFQTSSDSESLSRSVLTQFEHLKSLILMAGARRDTCDSQRLANLISELENVLHDLDIVRATPTKASTS